MTRRARVRAASGQAKARRIDPARELLRTGQLARAMDDSPVADAVPDASRRECELWLLDELYFLGAVPAPLFCPCVVEEALNRSAPWAHEGIETLIAGLTSMRDREWIEFSRDLKVFDPAPAQIRRAVAPCSNCAESPRRRVVVRVELTPAGIAAWEGEFAPDWDLYVDVALRAPGTWVLRGRHRDVLERVLGSLAGAGLEVIPESVRWSAPRPPRRLAGRPFCFDLPYLAPESWHGVTFELQPPTAERGLWVGVLGCDVESACPRWCSPFSRFSRYRGAFYA